MTENQASPTFSENEKLVVTSYTMTSTCSPLTVFPEKNGEEDVLHRVQQNRTNEIPVS